MVASILRVFTPSISKIIIFAIVSGILLSEKYQYIEKAAGTVCPIGANEKVNIGYPFVYFQHGRDNLTTFYPVKLILAILLAYFAACLLVYFATSVHRIVRNGSKSERIILVSILSNIVLAGYLAVVVFGETLLAKSIQDQQRMSVRLLLALGVSANQLTPNGESFSLLEAARVGNSEILDLLLKAGATPDVVNRDKTSALHIAAQQNNSAVALLLLKRGASVHLRDKSQKTALHYACSYAFTKLLSESGSDVNALDMFGNTALDYVKDDAIKSLLLGFNAKLGKELKTAPKVHLPQADLKDAEKVIKSDTIIEAEKPSKLRELPKPKTTLNCNYSIGGNLFRAGKKIPIAEMIDGKLTIQHGGHGFIYAKCATPGYYHIVIDNDRDYRKYTINLFPDEADADAPLLSGKKDTALIPFDMSPGPIWVRYYFSTKKIENIYSALEKGEVSSIAQINAFVRK